MTPQVVAGRVVSVEGPDEGPSQSRTYTVEWLFPDGSRQTIAGCGVRQIRSDDTMWRRAFEPGFWVIGLLLFEGRAARVMITDREDYAVGCNTDG